MFSRDLIGTRELEHITLKDKSKKGVFFLGSSREATLWVKENMMEAITREGLDGRFLDPSPDIWMKEFSNKDEKFK